MQCCAAGAKQTGTRRTLSKKKKVEGRYNVFEQHPMLKQLLKSKLRTPYKNMKDRHGLCTPLLQQEQQHTDAKYVDPREPHDANKRYERQ